MAGADEKTPPRSEDGGVADALRAAIDRTLAATAPAAGQTRDRAGEIVGEISKRGQDAKDELARRGQEAGAEIARLGQEARDALSKRGVEATGELRAQLDALEKRLASVEDRLKAVQSPPAMNPEQDRSEAQRKAEG
jgi:polyhydroxyalkanoate synthesis regulator phasin